MVTSEAFPQAGLELGTFIVFGLVWRHMEIRAEITIPFRTGPPLQQELQNNNICIHDKSNLLCSGDWMELNWKCPLTGDGEEGGPDQMPRRPGGFMI